jgi:MSHA biogenesis protein MshP
MKQTRLIAQRGFGYIAVIAVLVALAGLAAVLIRVGVNQQVTSSMDLASARAYQAAGAGIQWALHRTLVSADCPGANGTLDLSGATGFHVTVTCIAITFNEGETAPGVTRVKTLYSISAVACNANNCPDNAKAITQDYIERKRVATACVTGTPPSAC